MFVVFASIQGINTWLSHMMWILLTVSQQILVFNVNTDTYKKKLICVVRLVEAEEEAPLASDEEEELFTDGLEMDEEDEEEDV